MVTGAFAGGLRHGPFEFFASSGEKIAEIPYEQGKIHGDVRLWYHPLSVRKNEPRLKLQARYDHGVPTGAEVSWYPGGKPRARFRYLDGNLVDAEAWDSDGAALTLDDARRLAGQDLQADDRYYRTLEGVVDSNPPRCPSN
jgi:hypothetical protein